MELELTCSEEPSPRTRGHKDLKSRSGSPCRPLIAASFRSISRLFPREFYFSGQTRHHRETQPVFFGIALAGSKPPFSPSVSSRYQRNQPFPFYYLTGFLSPLEENIFVEIFSGEKKKKRREKIFKEPSVRIFSYTRVWISNTLFFSVPFRDISISSLHLINLAAMITIFTNSFFYSNISFFFRLLETQTSACLRLTINRHTYVMERHFHFSWRNAFHSRGSIDLAASSIVCI